MRVRAGVMLGLIVAAGLALRIVGAATAGLMFDESAHWASAETIDLPPGSVHLIPLSVDHPPISAYVVRISSLIFGTSNAGLRMLHVLVGTLTIVIVYLIARRVFSDRVALWSAALIAVDQFHVTWSYFFMPEVLLLFFLAVALLVLLWVVESGRPRDYVLYGFVLGVSYLAKETAVFFAVCVGFTTIAISRFRVVWRSPWWYVAHAVALATVSFDIYWNLTHFYEGYLSRDHRLVTGSWSVSPRALLLYVGELLEMVVPADVYSTDFSTQSPALCFWPAGLLYLAASMFALRTGSRPWAPALFSLFASGLFVFSVLPGHGTNDAYWWASATILPGIVLGAWLLDRIPRLASLALLGWLAAHAVVAVQRETSAQPRWSAQERTADILEDAKAAMASGRLQRLEWELNWTMHIVPPNADIFAYQARLAKDANEFNRAAYFVRRSLELDGQQSLALQVRKELILNGRQ